MSYVKNYIIKAGAVLLSVLYLSCETEVDLLTQDGDTTIIYAMLNPDEEIQLIKVNKSFIDPKVSAEELAKNPENFNFKEGELEITLQGYEDGVLKSDAFYGPATYTKGKYAKNQLSASGQPGIFASEDNVIYEIDTKDNPLDPDYKYVLTVTNTTTNEVMTAETEIIDNFTRSSLLAPGNTNLKFALSTSEYDDIRFEFQTPKDGSRFEIYLRVPYKVVDFPGGPFIDSSLIEIKMGEVSAPDAAEIPLQKLIFQFDGERFFKAINAEFSKDKTKRYLLDPMELKFVVGGQNLNTYIQVNEPSDGIVQERPEFTNVENGLGIVSSRREFIFPGYYLENNVTAREVKFGEYTRAVDIFVCHAERQQIGYTCPE